MADLPIRKRTLPEVLQHIVDRIRDQRPGDVDPFPIAIQLDVAAQEAQELVNSDAETWKRRPVFERERAEGAGELLMQWSLALEPPMPGRWHFGGGHVPHRVSACTDGKCWSPITFPDGRRGLLRLGWDVELAMVSPRQVIRIDPAPGETDADRTAESER
jgi:hypothetical protein